VRERGGAESMATRFVELGAMRLGPAGARETSSSSGTLAVRSFPD
jgi:hypothetical protein